eukprot:GILJ01003078.1.p1 GENE.GILJ01003078.1~~GILJ01003078.1.p1  ORF type:complete len:364 (+),score=76.81 GILJ01003078.1:50-1141(+)
MLFVAVVVVALVAAALYGIYHGAPTAEDMKRTDAKLGPGQVALITGPTAGIGLVIAKRLSMRGVKVYLGCRSVEKGQALVAELKKMNPSADVHFLHIDVSSMESVLRAADVIKKETPKVNFLFCNAGIYPMLGFNFGHLVSLTMKGDFMRFMGSGQDSQGCSPLMEPVGLKTKEGLGEVFASNVFGHFVLIQSLLDQLEAGSARVLFTGSRSATFTKRFFDWTDIQLLNAKMVYCASKYEIDLMAIALNKKYNSRNIRFFTCCPGMVATSITPPMLGWKISRLARCFVDNAMMTPEAGSEVLMRLITEDVASLNGLQKHVIKGRKLSHCMTFDEGDVDDSKRLYGELVQIAKQFTPASLHSTL